MHADVKQEYLGLGVAKMVRNKLGQTLELCVELALGYIVSKTSNKWKSPFYFHFQYVQYLNPVIVKIVVSIW